MTALALWRSARLGLMPLRFAFVPAVPSTEFLLKEDGDFLLLEDGDKLVLE